jgi:hypothetical protein
VILDFLPGLQREILEGGRTVNLRCQDCKEPKATCRKCKEEKKKKFFLTTEEKDERSRSVTKTQRRYTNVCLDCHNEPNSILSTEISRPMTSEPTCGSCGRKAPEAERNWNNAQGALWYHEFQFNLYAVFQYLWVG